MELGALIHMSERVDEAIAKLASLGFTTSQLCCWQEDMFTDEYAEKVTNAARKHGVTISAFWCGYSAPIVWNFHEGHTTLGLVPAAYRHARMKTLINGSAFARKLGVTDIITHVGFIPENPNDPDYAGLLSALREICRACKSNDLYFLFETGQETPVTLLRAIEDIGMDNVGINFDPANLLMYGKANPIDALDIFGGYVRGVHAKDGEYPTGGRELGMEKPLGQGRVNFPALIAKLKEIGYNRPVTIEREIDGDKQTADILAAKKLLEALINA